MPASAALRFAKDVRQIKKAADVLTALQNAIPANDIRVAAAWYLPKSYTDHTAIVPGKTRLGLFAPARAARAFLAAGRYTRTRRRIACVCLPDIKPVSSMTESVPEGYETKRGSWRLRGTVQ